MSRRLFMVRLENGNSMILQAEDEQEALDFVTGDEESVAREVAKMKADYPDRDEADIRLTFMQAGIGPQRATIRELSDFCCLVRLTDDGRLRLSLDGDETAEVEIYADYPLLQAAEFAIGGQRIDTPFAKEKLAEAVKVERTRLTFAEVDHAG